MITGIHILAPVVTKLQRRTALSNHECEAILALPLRYMDVKKGAFLVHEGDQKSTCCALLAGFVCTQKTTAGGAMQILSLHLAGDLVDLQNGLLGVADHSVQAVTAVRVASLPSTEIMALAEAHPRIARALWTDTLVDASIAREWILNVGQRTARQRISHLFCELALRQREISGNSEYHLPLNQDQIASATGITPVHVNRTIQGMRADGIVRLLANKLSIINWAALKVAGDFNGAYLHLKDGIALDRQMAA